MVPPNTTSASAAAAAASPITITATVAKMYKSAAGAVTYGL